MTAQVSVGDVTPRTAVPDVVVPTPRLPRPRGPRLEEGAPSPTGPPPSSGRSARSRAVRVGRRAMAVDWTIALVLGTAGAASGVVPPAAAAGALAWPLVLLASGLYRRQGLGEGRAWQVRRVVGTGVRLSVVVLAAAPLVPSLDVVPLVGLVAVLSAASALHDLVGPGRPRLVLAGHPRDVAEALRELEAADNHRVVAACLTRPSKVDLGEVPTYVGLRDAASIAEEHAADAFVVLPGSRLAPAQVRRMHWALAAVGTELCVSTGLLDVTPDRTRFLTTGGLHLVHVAPAALRGPRRWVKEVVERCAATVGLALALPALLAVGAAVRLQSPGPALYRQVRVGRDGQVFTMYKFRSMTVSAEHERTSLACANDVDGVLFKMYEDPRVTSLGRWLRRWSIDELPQLWNVVRGDMSLVGPRPALPEEVARYDVDPTRRLVVKPGLTGLWQVSGRSDLSWAQAVRLDVRYVDNWSLRLDAQILLRTVRAVLGHRGAY
ncbi:exopolysaccharide biosynthesis polyprenyl glycosylphosphotransferase [Nocardioides baculatus]|uniref:Exopolysaccharide biosynthesis polyprenyl glycosylphosphotransferase n=1 Tax=Nocardioides baculatus TaxID=2801337 RepID=A0ABS1L9Z3_9ACTN|nr:exopolysaccharide biosynthesis polyprenyl glycosylphosphotransferase [Nocardioides baculatus]MBL0748500.1 exopolysaccharide biosynthesis polyprenyl glycosylphosphotransferase [Nocardioides baculatus]